jgi:hypothetical protein
MTHPQNDWRKEPRRLIGIMLVFSTPGVVIGNEVFDFVSSLLGVELPPWRQ